MSTQEDRNFGYGAAGEVSTVKSQKHSFKDRIRYRFDNSINKGQGAFVAWLAIFGLIFSFVISIIRLVLDGKGEVSVAVAFRELLWGTSNSVLFDVDGASINVQPITDYIEVGKEVLFGQLVALAASRGESAIGYYSARHKRDISSSAVALNPEKTITLTVREGDGLIVVGELR